MRRGGGISNTILLKERKETVILELGVGMNAPGVLRWPNEDFVRKGDGKVKLVRVRLGPSHKVLDYLEGRGVAVSVEGDIKLALPSILTRS